MELIRTKAELTRQLTALRTRESQKKLVLVPTMGYLHAGHEELLRRAKALGVSAVSIFINPLQFNDPRDYENYPRNTERDIEVCRRHGMDLVFTPSQEAIYAEKPGLQLAMPALTRHLCGARHPGHFEGVMLIVLKLLHLFQPDIAIFGKKDYQQYQIVKQMAKELELPLEIRSVETVREADGLAYSSRNVHLSSKGRQNANLIYRALKIGEKAYQDGQENAAELKEIIKDVILSGSLNTIDYVETVDIQSLEPLGKLSGRYPFLLAVAVFCEGARLIDNLECRPRGEAGL